MKTLFVKTVVGKTYEYSIDSETDKVGYIKQLIHKEQGSLKIKQIDLVYENKVLSDSLSLLDLMKDDNSIQIHMIYKEKQGFCMIF